MNKFAGMVSPTNVSFTGKDGKNHVISTGHPNNERIRELMRETRAAFLAGEDDRANDLWEELTGLSDIPASIAAASQGRVEVRDDEVYFMDEVLHNAVTRRILWCLQETEDPTPYMKFLDNLMENPSKRAVDELFGFLEACNMGITDEGMILAYKRVREDYMDIHSGTIRNAVGDSPSMPRNKVDENKDRTCSDGLHFCSFSYLPHFGSGPGSKVVILEIHPKDVVAIPSDYNDAKGRTCAYTVIGEYQGDDINDILSAKPVWKPNDVRSNFGNADYRRAEQSVLERFLDALRDNDARGDLNDAPIDGDTTLGELPYAVRAQIVRIVDEDFGGSYEIDDYLLSDDDLTLGEIAEMTRDGGNERDENEDEDWDGDTDESEGTDASIEARVVRILSDHMGVGTSQITPDSKIMDDLGADSLDIVELIMAFEEDFNVDISDADADSILTVRDLVAGLENLTTGQPVVPVMSANPTPAASGQTTVFIYPETDGNETRWIAECADCNGGKGWKQRYARKRDARRGIRRSLGENVAIIERDL